MKRQKSSPVLQYLTFPTSPPKNCGLPPTSSTNSSVIERTASRSHEIDRNCSKNHSPLPVRQLTILAIIAFAEQTALNSISPYLPEMISTFPGVNPQDKGLLVGTIASSFALAQLATNFFWGWLSDHIGRKPVIMLGTLLTAICFVVFGFCKNFSQAILVHVLMGLVNGNQGVISSCLGDITDKSNQSRVFVYVPVIYGIGAMSGPALGGLLINNGPKVSYPFLLPNLFSATILIIDFIITGLMFKESLERSEHAPSMKKKIIKFSSFIRNSLSNPARALRLYCCLPRESRHQENHRAYDQNGASDYEEQNESLLSVTEFLSSSQQLSNISFNSLYPIFASESEPIGRNLTAEEIGLSLSFGGLVTIVFQVGIFGWGASKVWLWAELGFVLFLKTVAAVGGLTSASLLITNTAPSHSVLGTLNGLAQTFSAAGRALGPFISGGLFSIVTAKFKQVGTILTWSVFAGVAFCGFIFSFGIQGRDLESEEWAKNKRGDEIDESFGVDEQ